MKVKLALVAAMLATSAHAEFWDGNKLYEKMRGETLEQMQALGYVMGVSDVGQGSNHCPTANVTAGQMEDVVRRYLFNNPSVRHYTADSLILRALKLVFPCQQSGGGKSL